MTREDSQKGLVLLYALLIISLITAIAIAVSIVVVNELKLTGSAADAAMAYYAAESGVERGLYGVKVFRNEAGVTLDAAVQRILAYTDDQFNNNAKYSDSQTSAKTSKIEHAQIKKDEYVQADYFDINDPLDKTPPANVLVKSVVIQNGAADAGSFVEVSWTAWDTNGTLMTSDQARLVLSGANLEGNGWPFNIYNVFGSTLTPVGYRIRIRALQGDLSDITVTPYSDEYVAGTWPTQEVTDLPSQLQIKSVGTRGDFKQSLIATVPWQVPLFGLYDYVLFSEGEIAKTITLNKPIYASGAIQVEADLAANEAGCQNTSCGLCQDILWHGLACFSDSSSQTDPRSGQVSCFGGQQPGPGGEPAGTCSLDAGNNFWGWTLPIPSSVPSGDEFYISLRAYYVNVGDKSGRKIAVEIGGQSSVINDQGTADTVSTWHTCTVADSFTVGDPTRPPDDPSRTIMVTAEPLGFPGTLGSGWDNGEQVFVDWYQLSTYKIYPDCP